ncbi:MAG: hypothetical protein P8L77_03670 [Gammaproteobacteria bacterium]|nr:hypothetical protein [Gammaproteobacteria bacterium]
MTKFFENCGKKTLDLISVISVMLHVVYLNCHALISIILAARNLFGLLVYQLVKVPLVLLNYLRVLSNRLELYARSSQWMPLLLPIAILANAMSSIAFFSLRSIYNALSWSAYISTSVLKNFISQIVRGLFSHNIDFEEQMSLRLIENVDTFGHNYRWYIEYFNNKYDALFSMCGAFIKGINKYRRSDLDHIKSTLRLPYKTVIKGFFSTLKNWSQNAINDCFKLLYEYIFEPAFYVIYFFIIIPVFLLEEIYEFVSLNSKETETPSWMQVICSILFLPILVVAKLFELFACWVEVRILSVLSALFFTKNDTMYGSAGSLVMTVVAVPTVCANEIISCFANENDDGIKGESRVYDKMEFVFKDLYEPTQSLFGHD